MRPPSILMDPAQVERLLQSRAGRVDLGDPASRGLTVIPGGPRADDGATVDRVEHPPIGADDRPPEIWLYSYIGFGGIYAQDVRWALDQLADAPEVLLRIHSRGGSTFEGAAIYTILQQARKRIRVQVDGVALSAACNLCMVGAEVSISPLGMMMYHEAWDCACGRERDLLEVASLLHKINPAIAGLYERRLGMSRDQIMAAMYVGDQWHNADEAVAAGLADRILADAVEVPRLDDLGEAADGAPAAAFERFVRPLPGGRRPAATPPPRPTAAAEVLAYLTSTAGARAASAAAPRRGLDHATITAVSAALGLGGSP